MTVPEEVLKITTDSRLLNYYAMSYESLLGNIFDACTEQKRRETGDGSKVMQTCTILDLKDIKLGNASSAYKFVKPASEMAQNNYPEILGKYLSSYAVCLSSTRLSSSLAFGPWSRCGLTIKRNRRYRY